MDTINYTAFALYPVMDKLLDKWHRQFPTAPDNKRATARKLVQLAVSGHEWTLLAHEPQDNLLIEWFNKTVEQALGKSDSDMQVIMSQRLVDLILERQGLVW